MEAATKQLKVRLPEDVKLFLEQRARQQERSMGAHIVFLLRQDMEIEAASGAKPGSTSPDAFNQ
ncbi:Arc family DNA-binding protein [Kozakia baliensis]|uniref:Arc family DNA-binding protein n=1 Tax=Kozakia baliensis TaxID=153496 RepID=UPI0013646E9C|nr:Arc family DNA-binding protein [Kozakia baliensis]